MKTIQKRTSAQQTAEITSYLFCVGTVVIGARVMSPCLSKYWLSGYFKLQSSHSMIPLVLRSCVTASTEDCGVPVQRQDGRVQKVALVVPSCMGRNLIKAIDSVLFFFFF